MPSYNPSTARNIRLLRGSLIYLSPLVVSLVFYSLSPNDITWIQFLLAFILLLIPVVAYFKWRRQPDAALPVFALISLMYWIYFAVALFWGARTPSGVDTVYEKLVTDESVTFALLMTTVGVCAIWLGMKVRLDTYLVPKKLPSLKPGRRTLHYLRLLLIVSTLLSLSETLPYLAGEGARQVFTIVLTMVPLVAFSILFRQFLVHEAANIDKVLVLGFLALRLVVGLSSGWLGAFASIIVVCAGVYLSEKKKIPRMALLLVVLFTLFFQVGKPEFRRVYWKTESQTGKVDRVIFWAETSLSKWDEALHDQSGSGLAEVINASLSRVSLLTQTANVIDLTPATVPFQQGRLYSYLLVTWVPRAIWPDKPSMSEANQFYQIAYGLSTEEGLENVAIGVGVMTEAYISFGWYGVAGIMFLMGVFYSAYQRMFLTERSGPLMTAVGIALLPQIIAIEGQMAGYLGGLLQQVGFTLILFLPVIRWKSQRPVSGWYWSRPSRTMKPSPIN